MNKLSVKAFLKIKQDIKNRYLAGEAVSVIAASYDCITRNIYYHLGELSAEEKGIHAQNSSLHYTLKKHLKKQRSLVEQKRKEVKRENEAHQSSAKEVYSGLADFK